MQGFKGGAQSALAQGYMQQTAVSNQPAPPMPTIGNQTSRLSSLVSQLSEMCAKAEHIADRVSGSRPEKGESGSPKAVPNGAVDELVSVASDFGMILSRLEVTLNRIGDAL